MSLSIGCRNILLDVIHAIILFGLFDNIVKQCFEIVGETYGYNGVSLEFIDNKRLFPFKSYRMFFIEKGFYPKIYLMEIYELDISNREILHKKSDTCNENRRQKCIYESRWIIYESHCVVLCVVCCVRLYNLFMNRKIYLYLFLPKYKVGVGVVLQGICLFGRFRESVWGCGGVVCVILYFYQNHLENTRIHMYIYINE